jgi:hypothetical protein
MKKPFLIVLALLCYSFAAYSQDLGYNTIDVGMEYKWSSNSPNINLQLALNAKIHHSFLISAGYKSAYKPIPNTHNNEKGRGWGGSLGYRYYFGVVPKRVFLGIRGEVWSFGMYRTANETAENVQVMIFQPHIEAGYTAVINDIFYITPLVSYSKQITVSSDGDTFLYGNGYVPSVGISMGWRF